MHQLIRSGRRRLAPAKGFTLVEVLIVVVIVGVLLAVALPGYQSSLQKGRRTDAKTALLDVANRQERFMLDNGTYTTNMADLGLPVPYVSEEKHYTVTAAACGSGITRCYTLTAAPASTSPQSKDECGSFILQSTGAEAISGSGDDCW